MINRLSIQSYRLAICVMASVCCLQLAVQAQQQPTLQARFNTYQQQVLQEKLFVHTDKNFYLSGEICWFKIYNTDLLFNRPLAISKIVYLEILDKSNKPVLQAKVPMKEGSGYGSLLLPGSLGSGKYRLRAYTSWMKNFDAAYFFEKGITVINTRKAYEAPLPVPKSKYDIQFFPEGGNLVNGLQSKIAFRVVGQNGAGIACSGVVINDKADTVARYTTCRFGMGQFLFTPESGRVYKAITVLSDSNHEVNDLPVAYNTGYVMRLETAAGGKLKIKVQSVGTPMDTVYLFVHTRGAVKAVLGNALQNGAAEFLIDTGRLGDGISHFTVFNQLRQPVCERLFFRRPIQHLAITAGAAVEAYEQRKKVSIKIRSADEQGKSIAADMSMAVYRIDSLTQPDEMDISSYLWLSADLVGNIESAAWYLSSNEPGTATATDNLMLTQGWRRFRWSDVLQQQLPSFQFTPEYKGHIIKGRVTNATTGKPVSGAACFLSVAGTRTQLRGDFSNDSGYVQFEMNHFYGNDEIIVQVDGRRDSLFRVEIVNPFSTKFSGGATAIWQLQEKNAASLYNEHVSVQVQNTFSGNKLKELMLPVFDTLPFYSKPDNAYKLDDYVRFTTMEEILREYVPFVNVRKRDGVFYLPVFDLVRKEFFQVDPLVLLDGMPVFDINKLMAYDPLKIRTLEVVARTYYYGNMFFGGIINFITYNGDLPGYELDPQTTVMDYKTLQLQRTFFSPVYETPAQENSRMPDFRNVLYWNPELRTTAQGEQEAVFYTSDVPGDFVTVVQGLTADGKTGSTAMFFRVKENPSVATKK